MKKFKIGDTVVWIGCGKCIGKIEAQGEGRWNDCWKLSKAYNSCHEGNLRLATDKEINEYKKYRRKIMVLSQLKEISTNH